jgi:hypothetical protein
MATQIFDGKIDEARAYNRELSACEVILIELMKAAKPFTSGDIVTETMGTIPLMERLEEAIDEAEKLLEK